MSGKNGGHRAVRMKFLTGVADMLAHSVNANEKLLGNLHWSEIYGQQTEHFDFTGSEGERHRGVRVEFDGGSFMEQMDQHRLVGIVRSDERKHGDTFSQSRSGHHSYVSDRRDVAANRGDYGWAVLSAESRGGAKHEDLHSLVALSSKNLISLVPKYFLGLGVPEHDSLIEVYAVGSIGRVPETVEYACWESGFLVKSSTHPHRQYSPYMMALTVMC